MAGNRGSGFQPALVEVRRVERATGIEPVRGLGSQSITTILSPLGEFEPQDLRDLEI